jgi:thioredoxin reductase (NADPH)
MVAKGATGLSCDRQPYGVRIDGGPPVTARAVIIATGAEYRKPALANLSQFEGAGVYYGATPMEAQLCLSEEVIVVGGGNSAGQAAVFLAQTARRVHMLVRGEGLAGHHVALSDSAHRRQPCDRAADAHADRRPRGERPPRTSDVA